jgi:mannose-6-phosphate isomerase
MGAHPDEPSRLRGDGSLAEAIAADPVGLLGERVAAEYGARLPFLVTLLAADEPLSLQAHPDPDQARSGFDAEEAAGIAPDDPRRNYADPFHKPELICAVTPFEALCGFRAPSAALAVLDSLGLDAFAGALGSGGIRGAVQWLFGLDPAALGELSFQIATAAAKAEAGWAGEIAADLGERYPGDPGVALSLLLSPVRLAPGEAMFLPAGCPHGYLRGVGIEVMASSDNVIRGGLTRKRVDVGELLRILRFDTGPLSVSEPAEVSPGVRTWRPPVREFTLTRAELTGEPVRLRGDGPRILFCLSGHVTADDGGGPRPLPPGEAAFVPAGRPTALAGTGVAFTVTTA